MAAPTRRIGSRMQHARSRYRDVDSIPERERERSELCVRVAICFMSRSFSRHPEPRRFRNLSTSISARDYFRIAPILSTRETINATRMKKWQTTENSINFAASSRLSGIDAAHLEISFWKKCREKAIRKWCHSCVSFRNANSRLSRHFSLFLKAFRVRPCLISATCALKLYRVYFRPAGDERVSENSNAATLPPPAPLQRPF